MAVVNYKYFSQASQHSSAATWRYTSNKNLVQVNLSSVNLAVSQYSFEKIIYLFQKHILASISPQISIIQWNTQTST